MAYRNVPDDRGVYNRENDYQDHKDNVVVQPTSGLEVG
jgi:hypothetical protein